MKTHFTADNDSQYNLFTGSFGTSLSMFQEPFLGFLLPEHFDQKKTKGFRMRSGNTQYPFDGQKERMVDDGKDIILVSIVFGLLVSNDFGISPFSIHRFWLYTNFDI